MPFLIAGCQPVTAPSSIADAATSDPIYRKNPHPTQAYRITMVIEDAPGSFGAVAGTAFYDMTNRDDCAPFDAALGMSTKPKEDAIEVEFKRINETTYVARIYADGMMDADYYGKGVCHWKFGGVGVSLKATGKSEETEFLPSLSGMHLASLTSETTYFWKSRYPKSEMAAFPDVGQPTAEEFNENARRNLFKVTLTAEKDSP
ncbi:hypothetical protein [Xanthomonas melonis]|uniref:hypothetical protein n=1 Tax=Xanthomonas melonis TaxID=56456 RepID=UPI003CCD4516